MNFHVLRIEFAVVAHNFFKSGLCFCGIGEDITAFNVNRKLSLFIHLAQIRVDPLMDLFMLREPGIEDAAYATVHDGGNNVSLSDLLDIVIQKITVIDGHVCKLPEFDGAQAVLLAPCAGNIYGQCLNSFRRNNT